MYITECSKLQGTKTFITAFLALLSHWLMVSYCDRWMSAVCRQQLLQRASPKLLSVFWPNLAEMILIWPSIIIVQMVLVCCISRSHRLKIDFRDKNFKNLLVWNHKAYTLDIWYVESPSRPLPSLFKLCPLGQKWASLGGHMLYIGLYMENMKKASFLKSQGIEPGYFVCSITW